MILPFVSCNTLRGWVPSPPSLFSRDGRVKISVQAFSWVIEKSRQSGSSLLVMLMIANHAHSDGAGAYPSLDLLALETRMSKRAVQYIIQKNLVPSGELIVQKRNRMEDEEGRWGRNTYVLPGVVRDGFHLLGAKVAPSLRANSKTLSAKRPIVHATAIATEPSFEPSVEPKYRSPDMESKEQRDKRKAEDQIRRLERILREDTARGETLPVTERARIKLELDYLKRKVAA